MTVFVLLWVPTIPACFSLRSLTSISSLYRHAHKIKLDKIRLDNLSRVFFIFHWQPETPFSIHFCAPQFRSRHQCSNTNKRNELLSAAGIHLLEDSRPRCTGCTAGFVQFSAISVPSGLYAWAI